MNSHFGFVVIDKPLGITSHDCVKQLRKIFGIKKIGHGGTLDPSVTGVLPIAIGNATRLLPYLTNSKGYIGTIELGKKTNTDDLEGKVIEEKGKPNLNNLELEKFLKSFRGEIMQRPPIFSSVSINGERAYKKARRGENFQTKEKKIRIKKLELLNWDVLTGQLKIYIQCSSGTYIRSLARDLGEKVGCGGVLIELRRIEASGFNESQSNKLQDIQGNSLLREESIINPSLCLKHLSKVILRTEKENEFWKTGRKIFLKDDSYLKPEVIKQSNCSILFQYALVLNTENSIIGIGEIEEDLVIKPKVVFNAKG